MQSDRTKVPHPHVDRHAAQPRQYSSPCRGCSTPSLHRLAPGHGFTRLGFRSGRLEWQSSQKWVWPKQKNEATLQQNLRQERAVFNGPEHFCPEHFCREHAARSLIFAKPRCLRGVQSALCKPSCLTHCSLQTVSTITRPLRHQSEASHEDPQGGFRHSHGPAKLLPALVFDEVPAVPPLAESLAAGQAAPAHQLIGPVILRWALFRK